MTRARVMLCLAFAAGASSAVSCGSDERERPQPVPTNPELERYSKPGAPTPDQADTIAAACAAMLQHEAKACGSSDDAESSASAAGAAGAAGASGADVDDCLRTWRLNDARGCGAAYARFIQCRTDTVDCENGWHPDCDLYEDAAFLCTTDFVQRTTCTPISVGNLCQDSAYGFGCVSPRKPFPECERVADSKSPAYCCF